MSVPSPVSPPAVQKYWVGAQLLLWRRGAAVPLAVLVAVVGLLIHFLMLLPARDALQAVTAKTAATQVAAAAESAPPMQAQPPTLKLVPSNTNALLVLRRMDDLARQQGVEALHAEYRIETTAPLELSRLRVVQPLRTSYAQARRYIAAVLQAEEGVSLDQVTFRREAIANQVLEVRLTWSLWLPPTPGQTPGESSTP